MQQRVIDKAKVLRERAVRCRAMALTFRDTRTVEALQLAAMDYEQQASRLDAVAQCASPGA